jgi:hypothetical protein
MRTTGDEVAAQNQPAAFDVPDSALGQRLGADLPPAGTEASSALGCALMLRGMVAVARCDDFTKSRREKWFFINS